MTKIAILAALNLADELFQSTLLGTQDYILSFQFLALVHEHHLLFLFEILLER